MRVRRAFAMPLPIGSEVHIKGRIKECAGLVASTGRLLDIGCSSGWLAPIVLAKSVQQYVGIDRAVVGRTFLSEARVSFIEASVFDLPFPAGSFDAACLFDVVEHLPRGTEGMALREVSRVLKREGQLYFSTPHASPIHSPLDPVWLLGHRHYRRQSVRYWLQAAGFRVDRLFVAGGVAECLDHIRLLIYKHVLRQPLPSISFVDGLIERSHGGDHRLGMTIFAVASRQ